MTQQEFEALVARLCDEIQAASREVRPTPSMPPGPRVPPPKPMYPNPIMPPTNPNTPSYYHIPQVTSGGLLGSVAQWAQIISAIKGQR